jgi:hypothetical protein
MPPLQIPFAFAPSTVANPPILANLDTDLNTVAAYVNARTPGVGLLANRPAAGNNGAEYLATDVQGGTLYVDDGAVWNQAAAAVTQQAPSNTTTIFAAFYLATL